MLNLPKQILKLHAGYKLSFYIIFLKKVCKKINQY